MVGFWQEGVGMSTNNKIDVFGGLGQVEVRNFLGRSFVKIAQVRKANHQIAVLLLL